MAFFYFSTFLMVAVAGRIVLHYILTGDHGVRVSKSNSPLIQKVTSGLLFIAFSGIFVLSFLEFKELINSGFALSLNLVVAGQILAGVGIVLTSISQYQMGKEWRIGVRDSEKTGLITTGVFRYSRNPIYLSIMIFCCGLLLILPHWVNAICVLLTYLGIVLHVIYVEEPYLEKLHGDAFNNYKQLTPRFFLF